MTAVADCPCGRNITKESGLLVYERAKDEQEWGEG